MSSLSLTKHYTMKTYREAKYSTNHSKQASKYKWSLNYMLHTLSPPLSINYESN
jgi:hypothetical protein